MTGLVLTSALRELAEHWLDEFESPEDGFHRLSANTGLTADAWRKRLAGSTDNPNSWWRFDAIDEADADALLTAMGMPEALTTLLSPAPGLRCEDCGHPIRDGDHRPLDLFRPDPSSQADRVWDSTKQRLVRRPGQARAGGRRFRIVDLCRRCAAEALRLRASKNPKVGHNGSRGVLSTRDRVAPLRGGRPRLLNDDELRSLHLVYDRTGRSIGDLATSLTEARSTGTRSGYYQSILYGWRRLNLALRPKTEQQAISHHLRGRVPRQPQRCPATTRKGTPCELFAKIGGSYCVSHQRLEERAA